MITGPRLDDPEMAVRYLSDKLSSPERETFEVHYLAHPRVVEEMELDAKLKAGLICIRDSNELDRLSALPRRFWAMMPVAIAACALAAVIVISAFRYAAPGAALASSAAALHRPLSSQLATGATYTLMQTRTGSYDAVIPLSKDPQAIKLQMVLDIEPPIPPLEITLAAIAADASRTDLLVLHQLRADENGVVTLYLNSSALAPGIYELSASRETMPAAAPENKFVLQLVPSTGSPPLPSP
jgi:hypothetical protein